MENELKKIEGLLLNDDRGFREVMDTSPVMLWITKDKLTVYLNKSWQDFTGRLLEKDLGKGWFELVHPDDMKMCKKVIPKAFHARQSYQLEYRLLHRSGEYRWILEKGTPIFYHNKTFRGFVGGCVDIDVQKKLETKFRASEERYRRLFESAYDGILILDSKTGEITDVNPYLEMLLGYSKKEFLGKKLWEVGVFKNTKASKETFKTLQKKGYARYDDLPLETKEGKTIEVEFISNAYIAGEERVMQCNIRDISERKKIELTEKALAYLEQERLKNRFIADATHELRTPLAVIKGNVELALRDKNKKTFPTETLHEINLEVDYLSEMLSDLTILTKENLNVDKKIVKNNH